MKKFKKKVFTKQISTSAKKQNCSTKGNTEKRHQQIPRKCRQNLNIQQRRPLTPRKFPARCLCLSNKIR